jgi:hypothetical protein
MGHAQAGEIRSDPGPRSVEHCPAATDEVQAVLIDAGGPLTGGYDDSLV